MKVGLIFWYQLKLAHNGVVDERCLIGTVRGSGKGRVCLSWIKRTLPPNKILTEKKSERR